ncbi:hypothetical protein SODALDRAFT_354243 [Sodiomyces alkalinus F11]|uniref:Uncharacterized protein n=1 Tax=Sodiomyces alkalinus (strain CBS 110278 / VKM F-3762 / F11) TaxID=1314773 RepID=A0A3N2Q5R5_SODAK|nr:hypothetical protein SODALDRAFT_354243 [Sodiomyces alkalinus F11]ROT42119.1 hypothetical protein SODALDRAFT_354243 [Sodiomyces alkalinus F11]
MHAKTLDQGWRPRTNDQSSGKQLICCGIMVNVEQLPAPVVTVLRFVFQLSIPPNLPTQFNSTRRAATFHASTLGSSLNDNPSSSSSSPPHFSTQHCKCPPREKLQLAFSPIRRLTLIHANCLHPLPATPHAVVLPSPLNITTSHDQRLSTVHPSTHSSDGANY